MILVAGASSGLGAEMVQGLVKRGRIVYTGVLCHRRYIHAVTKIRRDENSGSQPDKLAQKLHRIILCRRRSCATGAAASARPSPRR